MSNPAPSLARSETARINGAQSHGPVTAEGKARSSQNALRHGLRSNSVLIPGESAEELAHHRAAYIERLQPVGQIEIDLVEDMATARWRLKRIVELEVQLFARESSKASSESANESASESSGKPKNAPDDFARRLSLLIRYEGQLNRTYDKAFKTLQLLQAARVSSTKAPQRPPLFRMPNEPKRDSDALAFALLDRLTAPPTRSSAPQTKPSDAPTAPREASNRR